MMKQRHQAGAPDSKGGQFAKQHRSAAGQINDLETFDSYAAEHYGPHSDPQSAIREIDSYIARRVARERGIIDDDDPRIDDRHFRKANTDLADETPDDATWEDVDNHAAAVYDHARTLAALEESIVGTTEEQNPGMYSSQVGTKYDPKAKRSEVARSVRATFKELKEADLVPKHAEFHTRTRNGSMIVEVRGLSNDDIYKDPNGAEVFRGYGQTAKDIHDLSRRVLAAHNSNSSHPEIDYFNQAFYTDVKVEDEFERAKREANAVMEKAKKAGDAVAYTQARAIYGQVVKSEGEFHDERYKREMEWLRR